MKSNSTVRFAIVGYGHIGKRHAAMILNSEHCELVAVCDPRNPEKLSFVHEHVPFYASLEEMMQEAPPFEVLCIATPNGLHEEQAIKGLQKNLHVVIEKPMALTKAGCEHIIYEALRQHRFVFCVMQNRYSPPSIWLKSILEKKILGNIFLVQINCYWNRDKNYYTSDTWHGDAKLDGGTLFTQFSHFADIMFWLFGDIKNIKTRFRNFNHEGLIDFEDTGIVNFDFVKGGVGCINYSTSVWQTNLESSITIIAENGTVKVGGQYMNEVEYCNIRDYEMPVLEQSNPPNDYGAYKGSASNHHYIFENVVSVLHGTAPITTNALEGMKVVEIIEKIYSTKAE